MLRSYISAWFWCIDSNKAMNSFTQFFTFLLLSCPVTFKCLMFLYALIVSAVSAFIPSPQLSSYHPDAVWAEALPHKRITCLYPMNTPAIWNCWYRVPGYETSGYHLLSFVLDLFMKMIKCMQQNAVPQMLLSEPNNSPVLCVVHGRDTLSTIVWG